jgi:hypothetical protein
MKRVLRKAEWFEGERMDLKKNLAKNNRVGLF